MKTIFDYIQFYKDDDFIKSPFNDKDALVFAIFSYVKFDGIVPHGRRESISFDEAME